MVRCCGGGGDPVKTVVEDADKNTSTTLSSASAGCSEIIVDIGVVYVLNGVTSSVIEVVDMAGVGGSNDSIENGR
jgi:hypothetical protein